MKCFPFQFKTDIICPLYRSFTRVLPSSTRPAAAQHTPPQRSKMENVNKIKGIPRPVQFRPALQNAKQFLKAFPVAACSHIQSGNELSQRWLAARRLGWSGPDIGADVQDLLELILTPAKSDFRDKEKCNSLVYFTLKIENKCSIYEEII